MLRKILHMAVARGLSVALVIGQVLISVPAFAQAPAQRSQPFRPASTPPPLAPKVTVNRTVPKVTPPPAEPQFSAAPTVQEIFRARVFAEPLVPIGGEPTAGENLVLARALLAFHRSGGTKWESTLASFLVTHPESPWRASLLANVGAVQLHAHAYSLALQSWDEAWALAKEGTDVNSRAIGDYAVARWLQLSAEYGHIAEVEARLGAIADRPIRGSAGVTVSRVRETLALIRRYPEKMLPCGPAALLAFLAARGGAGAPQPEILARAVASGTALSLVALRTLAQRAGMSLQMIKRDGATDLPTPAIVHLRIGHYVTVAEQRGGSYQVVDRAMGDAYWISRDTLLAEMSGYALIDAGAVPAGWQTVANAEAANVSGMSTACPPGSPPGSPPDGDENGGDDPDGGDDGGDDGPCGMPGYRFQTVSASLVIRDRPAGYTPPRGPAVPLTVSYHQREALEPQLFSSSNLGPKWTFNWLRFVQEEPMDALGITPAHVWVFLPPGGREVYLNPDANGIYPAHWHSRAVLVRVSTSPLRYERRLPNGAVEVYAQSDGGPVGQRQVFMTELVDPAGQRLQFTWDAQLRLVAITDAIGQVSTMTYAHPTDPLKITRVTDPFARSASFSYNAAGQLASITDVLGLTSSFAYGANDFVSTLTTPYGVTSFRRESNAQNDLNLRFVEATDPLGATEHLEFQYQTPSLTASDDASVVPTGFAAWNAYLDHYNTFYWSKRAWTLGPGDLSKAIVTHWLYGAETSGDAMYAAVRHSVKRPLEARVWFAYPGQTTGLEAEIGWTRKPSRIGRVLDDGTSQVSEYTYNSQGSVLTETDPAGRQQTVSYATNGVDLLNAQQTTGGLTDVLATLASFTSGHRPQSLTDGAGQTTTVSYNSAGQALVLTNPKAETTTYGYDTNGRLTSLTGAVSGAVTTMTYDAYGRPRTVTTSDGYSVTIDYDVFDRVTRVTYPDGSYAEHVYDRLDLASSRDRAGRVTRYYYDPVRRLTTTRDPQGRTVTQEWCNCGALAAVVDGNGHRTQWERDLQGRVTREIRADAGATQYVYDAAAGRLTQRTDARDQHTNYQYFLDGRLKQVAYTNAAIATPTVTLTYDAAYGRLATMVDGIGTTSYTYTPVGQLGAGRVATVDGPLSNDTLTYTYDELGRVASRALNGVTGTWAYDALGRLASQADPIGTFTYAYDGATGRLTSLSYPNGQTSTYTYFGNTGDRRLQDIHHQTSASATLSRFSYAYDTVGNISTWTQQYGSDIKAYDLAYDPADQLTGATYHTTGTTPTVLKRYGYAYDPAGNRTSSQSDDAPSTWTYDANDRLTTQAGGGLLRVEGTVSEPATVTVQGTAAAVDGTNRFTATAAVTPGTTTFGVTATDASGNSQTSQYEFDTTSASVTYTYDANGNLTADGTRTFEWDAINRLVAVNIGTHRSEFAYDGLDRRVRMVEKENGATVRDANLFWDGTEIIEERLSTGEVNHFFQDGEQHNSVARYVTRDHLGSIREVTDSAGAVVTRNDYDPYGRLTRVAGTEDSRFGYTGHLAHTPSGLTLALYRAYDPTLGRWLSEDPAGMPDGPNRSLYVLNRPISAYDPDGRFIWVIVIPPILEALGWAAAYTGGRLAALWAGQKLSDALLAKHTKDPRPSTKEKHEQGDERRKTDQGGEKSDWPNKPDADPPRKRPDWYPKTGPWPPKPPKGGMCEK